MGVIRDKFFWILVNAEKSKGTLKYYLSAGSLSIHNSLE
jgi:hypothetical protein